MRLPRFFAPQASQSGATIELPDDEAAHLTRVLRLTEGARVRIFNGHGREWHATVHRVTRQSVAVTVNEAIAPLAESGLALTLAVAVLKGDKMDDIVRDAVMLGIAAIQPLLTTRTEVSPAAIQRSRRIVRWQRIAVSSAKQCGRAIVPAVHAAADLSTALNTPALKIMLVEPAAGVGSRPLAELPMANTATLLVGPEGGWTAEELGQAEASGAILMTLGALTLRADAVPLVALTALRVHWGDF